jgi:hypothetical protein
VCLERYLEIFVRPSVNFTTFVPALATTNLFPPRLFLLCFLFTNPILTCVDIATLDHASDYFRDNYSLPQEGPTFFSTGGVPQSERYEDPTKEHFSGNTF